MIFESYCLNGQLWNITRTNIWNHLDLNVYPGSQYAAHEFHLLTPCELDFTITQVMNAMDGATKRSDATQ